MGELIAAAGWVPNRPTREATARAATRAVKPVAGAVPLDRLLTVKEAGDEWHLGTGERYVRRLIQERRITFVKVGRHVRLRESDVRAFIDAGTVPAARS